MRLSVSYEYNEELRKSALISSLQKLDSALLNSALSYAVYTKNESWYKSWFHSSATRSEDRDTFAREIFKKHIFVKERIYDRAFAALIAEKMTPAMLELSPKAQHRSYRYKYGFDACYENGVYKALDNLAAASAVTSHNPDGTKTLHINFRGTDTLAESSLGQKHKFKDFFKKAYLDMAAYYDSFKPFERAVLEYASDPNNRITKIEVAGHSLGGAMVQHFFRSREVAKCSIAIQGFTYGSPPAVANDFYAMIPALRHMIKEGNFLNAIETVKEVVNPHRIRKDPRITQYQHMGDIVPKVGNLIMDKLGGEIVNLKDHASQEGYMDNLLTGEIPYIRIPAQKAPSHSSHLSLTMADKTLSVHSAFLEMIGSASRIMKKPLRFLKRMKETVYHDMARYTVNLDAQIDELKRRYGKELMRDDPLKMIALCPNNHSFGLSLKRLRKHSHKKVGIINMSKSLEAYSIDKCNTSQLSLVSMDSMSSFKPGGLMASIPPNLEDAPSEESIAPQNINAKLLEIRKKHLKGVRMIEGLIS